MALNNYMSDDDGRPKDLRQQVVKELDPSIFNGLTYKESTFLQEYLKDFNGAQAAIRNGSNSGSAKQIAHKMLKKPNVAKALVLIQEEIKKKHAWTVENSVKDIDRFIERAYEKNQLMALVGLQRHKDEITKVFQPGLKIDVNQKASFTVQMVGFAPPKYSDNQIDVTPKPELVEATVKKPDESAEE